MRHRNLVHLHLLALFAQASSRGDGAWLHLCPFDVAGNGTVGATAAVLRSNDPHDCSFGKSHLRTEQFCVPQRPKGIQLSTRTFDRCFRLFPRRCIDPLDEESGGSCCGWAPE